MPSRKRAPTRDDVARLANVSGWTVSNILSGNLGASIRVETRERVLAAARELVYVPNNMARALRSGKTKTIAIIIEAPSQSVHRMFLNAVQQRIWDRNYQSLLVTYRTDLDEEPSRLISNDLSQVEGVVCAVSYTAISPLLHEFAARGKPVVTFYPLEEIKADLVTSDRAQGAIEATEHLIKSGRKRIALYSVINDTFIFGHRTSGYLQAMRSAGLEPILVPWEDSNLSFYERGYQLDQKYKDLVLKLDAWILGDDEVAIGGMRALADLGIKVPEQLAVIGWNSSEARNFCFPRLTSVSHSLDDVADATIAQLFKRLGGDNSDPVHLRIRPQLVLRESC